MERDGEPAGEHLASEISPVRGSDKIEAACGLLSNSEGPGPPLDLKDFIKKASGGVWGGRGRSSRGALLVAKTQSVRTRSQLGGRGGGHRKHLQRVSAHERSPSRPKPPRGETAPRVFSRHQQQDGKSISSSLAKLLSVTPPLEKALPAETLWVSSGVSPARRF